MTLKKFREAQGLTQEQLGKKVSVTDAYITMLECGVRKNPSIDLLKARKSPQGDSGELLE
ncbi:MAG TPA: helix-turn-helix transcriptional regulator [Candidatus Methylomirabilis sp.]|nr:helix-turn-helix transcriptional regulator [Candidatus Methylomirabilis sp.]